MRYNPSCDQATDIEVLAEHNRKLISALPEPVKLPYVWSPEDLAYVPS